jgi:hypothetical protein
MSFSKESQSSRPVEGPFLPRRPRPHRILSSLRYDGDEVPVLIRLSELSWPPAPVAAVSQAPAAAASAAPPPQAASSTVSQFGGQAGGFTPATLPAPGHANAPLPGSPPSPTPASTMLTAAGSGSIPTQPVHPELGSYLAGPTPFSSAHGVPAGANVPGTNPLPAGSAFAPLQQFAVPAQNGVPVGNPLTGAPLTPLQGAIPYAAPVAELAGRAGENLYQQMLSGSAFGVPHDAAHGASLVPSGSPFATPSESPFASLGVANPASWGARPYGPAYPPLLGQEPASASGSAVGAMPSTGQVNASTPWSAPFASPSGNGASPALGMPLVPGSTSSVESGLGREGNSPAWSPDALRHVSGSSSDQVVPWGTGGLPASSPAGVQASASTTFPQQSTGHATASLPELAAARPSQHVGSAQPQNASFPSNSSSVAATMPVSSAGMATQPSASIGSPRSGVHQESVATAASMTERTTASHGTLKSSASVANKVTTEFRSGDSGERETKSEPTATTNSPGVATDGILAEGNAVPHSNPGSRVGTGKLVETSSQGPANADASAASGVPLARENRQRNSSDDSTELTKTSPTPSLATSSHEPTLQNKPGLFSDWDRSKTVLALVLAFVSGLVFLTLKGQLGRSTTEPAANAPVANAPAAAPASPGTAVSRTTVELSTELGPSEQHSPARFSSGQGRVDRLNSPVLTNRGENAKTESNRGSWPRVRSVQLIEEETVVSSRSHSQEPLSEVEREEVATGWPLEETDSSVTRRRDESESNTTRSSILEAASSDEDAVQGWPDEAGSAVQSDRSDRSSWEADGSRSGAGNEAPYRGQLRTSRLDPGPTRPSTDPRTSVQGGSGLQGTIEIPRARVSQEHNGSYLH